MSVQSSTTHTHKQITLHYFYGTSFGFASCHCCSVTESCPTFCGHLNCSMPGFPVLHYFLEFAQTMSIGLVVPSNHFILYHPLFLLPSIFPSLRMFSNESVLHIRWPEYWSFSFGINPSSEYSGLISSRIDWLCQYLKEFRGQPGVCRSHIMDC